MMPAVAYTRVSSAEQLREGFSIPAQQLLVRDYAEKNGIALQKEFSDDESGGNSRRRGFVEMVAYLRSHPNVRTIIAEKVDRLYRNFRDPVTLDDLGVTVHFVKDGMVYGANAPARDQLNHDIRLALAKNYLANLSEEVKKGMRQKAAEGGWPTWAPLGYLNVKDASGRATIVPDPAKAHLVREIFEAAARGGYSLANLCTLADRIQLRGRFGTKITKGVMAYIVRNPAYTGTFTWSGKTYHGKYEPLIGHDLFARAQHALDGGSKPKTRIHEFTYSGLLRCGVCGGSLTGDRKKGRYVYYFCRCKRWYAERIFDAAAISALQSLPVSRPVSETIIRHLTRWYDTAEVRDSVRAGSIRRRLTELQRLAAASYEEKLLGRVGEETWREINSRWELEAGELRAELAMIAPAMGRSEFIRAVRAPFELAQSAAAQFLAQSPAERGRLLKTCCSNFIITDGSVSIQMKSPFDVLVKIAGSPDWLGRMDSNHRMSAPKTDALPLGDSPSREASPKTFSE
jgi:site-specific DNA recombinase